jgi:hypothetical protein
MNKLQKFSAALLLIVTFSLSAFAGQIEIGSPQPAPTPASAAEGEMTTGVNGDIHTTNSDEVTAGEAAVAGALGVLQGVLSLL